MKQKDVGLLFTDQNVRAIREGRKDQTRRVVVPQPWKNGPGYFWRHGKHTSEIEADYIHTDEATVRRWVEQFAPYRAGDTIWVRECAKIASVGPGKREVALKFRADEMHDGKMPSNYQIIDHDVPDGEKNPFSLTRWTPGMFMPRWASRIRLQILLVQVERVQEITEGDAKREGVVSCAQYRDLWDSLNLERGFTWSRNPWVYVISFRRMTVPRGT